VPHPRRVFVFAARVVGFNEPQSEAKTISSQNASQDTTLPAAAPPKHPIFALFSNPALDPSIHMQTKAATFSMQTHSDLP
jgi:hypothetical protein